MNNYYQQLINHHELFFKKLKLDSKVNYIEFEPNRLIIFTGNQPLIVNFKFGYCELSNIKVLNFLLRKYDIVDFSKSNFEGFYKKVILT